MDRVTTFEIIVYTIIFITLWVFTFKLLVDTIAVAGMIGSVLQFLLSNTITGIVLGGWRWRIKHYQKIEEFERWREEDVEDNDDTED